MSTTPDNTQFCTKVSADEAKKQMQETTQAELAKLAELMKTQKLPVRRDIMSDEESVNSDDSDSDDEDYVPSKRKRTHKPVLQQDVESKMYLDNQNLWKKIHKYGIELNRNQKELHYLQLELNNKTVDCNELKDKCRSIDILTEQNQKLNKTLLIFKIWNYFYFFMLCLVATDYVSEHTFFEYIKVIFFYLKNLL